MKKFIDKESGKIVTVLNVEEAKKILEMYIEYCQGKREVKKGRLNLVNYLGDFIKYSNEKDMSKFYDTLLKLKENFEFSKNEQKAYDSLLSFFEIYNNIDKGEFEVSKVTSFITATMSKKQTIDEKILGNQELNFEEKITNIFFNENFDLSILAKNACDKWDELLKQKIDASNGEIEVSLKEEIAYQDLLAFSNKENIIVSSKNNDENDIVINEPNEEDTVEIEPENNEKEEMKNAEIEVEVEVEEDKTKENFANENSKEESKNKEEEFVGPIIVNSFNDKKEEEKENDANSSEIIGASTINEKTSDVSLRDAANLFNQAIDDVKENNNQNANSNNSDTQGSSSSYGTLRDM